MSDHGMPADEFEFGAMPPPPPDPPAEQLEAIQIYIREWYRLHRPVLMLAEAVLESVSEEQIVVRVADRMHSEWPWDLEKP